MNLRYVLRRATEIAKLDNWKLERKDNNTKTEINKRKSVNINHQLDL